MPRITTILYAITAGGLLATMPQAAQAQRTEGDARSPMTQWGRQLAPEGTFWLDSNEDREVVRYSQRRDVQICLPRPEGVNAAERTVPLKISWDGVNTTTLYPGNCLYFDAMRVSVKPAAPLPSGTTLTGRFHASRS